MESPLCWTSVEPMILQLYPQQPWRSRGVSQRGWREGGGLDCGHPGPILRAFPTITRLLSLFLPVFTPPEDQLPPGFPNIDMGPQLKVVERTRTATMLCAASGNPDPEITWFKDFLPVDPSASNGRIKQLRSGGHRWPTGCGCHRVAEGPHLGPGGDRLVRGMGGRDPRMGRGAHGAG